MVFPYPFEVTGVSYIEREVTSMDKLGCLTDAES